MVNKKSETLPTLDDVVKVLFEHFCECCELGEDGCIQPETKTTCPVFWAIQFLLPDNPFVLRIMGRYMTCTKCQKVGLAPPTSDFNAQKQPILVCQHCGAPVWRNRDGLMVNKREDIDRSFAVKIVDEDGALKVRSAQL